MSLEKLEREDEDAAHADLVISIGVGPAEADLQRLAARLQGEVDDDAEDVRLLEIGRAWMMGARVVLNTVLGRQPCRICGCWELEACEQGCGWAEPGLCTACAEPG